PDHPAQEQIQPLAWAAERGQREEMPIAARDTAARKDLAQIGLEERAGATLGGGADRAARLGIAGQETLLESAEAGEEITGRDAEGDEVARPIEAIPEVVEGDGVAPRVEPGDERGGRRPHARQDAFELAAEQVDPAVGEARGQQA